MSKPYYLNSESVIARKTRAWHKNKTVWQTAKKWSWDNHQTALRMGERKKSRRMGSILKDCKRISKGQKLIRTQKVKINRITFTILNDLVPRQLKIHIILVPQPNSLVSIHHSHPLSFLKLQTSMKCLHWTLWFNKGNKILA